MGGRSQTCPNRYVVATDRERDFLAPPLLLIIMLVSNNTAAMGERINGPGINALGWVTTAAMSRPRWSFVYLG